jgi:hypothetical protein
LSFGSFVGIFILRLSLYLPADSTLCTTAFQQTQSLFKLSTSSYIKPNRPTTFLNNLHLHTIIMQIPSYGAAPISATFLGARALQLTFLVVLIGLTANFVNGMVMQNHDPSREIVGALVIVSKI